MVKKKTMFLGAALALVALQGVVVAGDLDLGFEEQDKARINEGVDQNTVLGLGIVVGLVAIPLAIRAFKETLGVI